MLRFYQVVLWLVVTQCLVGPIADAMGGIKTVDPGAGRICAAIAFGALAIMEAVVSARRPAVSASPDSVAGRKAADGRAAAVAHLPRG